MSIIKNNANMPHNDSGNFLIPSIYVPTSPTLPAVVTTEAYGIGNDYIYTGGNVTDDGGLQILDRGICYGLTTLPTIADTSINKGINAGYFLVDIEGLNVDTEYFIRSFAVNSLGLVYGNEITATTRNVTLFSAPLVNTLSSYAITAWNFNIIGEVSSNGGKTITQRGFYYGTTPDTSISGTKIISGGYKVEEYSDKVTLFDDTVTSDTIYYYQAFAINEEGEGLGEVKNTETLPYINNVFDTLTPSDIRSYQCTSGIHLEAWGYPDFTIYGEQLSGVSNSDTFWYGMGLCWGESPNPTIADASTGDIYLNQYYITPPTDIDITFQPSNSDTTYYIRSFCHREIDHSIIYGSQKSVYIPLLTLPTVETLNNTGATDYVTILEGNIININTPEIYPIQERGFFVATHNNPTAADIIISAAEPIEIGNYSNTYSIPSSGTYYYRAYIRYNISGSGLVYIYGAVESFTSGSGGAFSMDVDAFDKTDQSLITDTGINAVDYSVYNSVGIRYYPESMIPLDRIIGSTEINGTAVQKLGFSTNPNVQDVYYRFMSTAPFRSIGPAQEPGESFYFTQNITAPVTGNYVLGIMADNFYEIKINGSLYIKGDTTLDGNFDTAQTFFKELNMFEIPLLGGTNLLEFKYINDGGPAVIGLLVWDNTFDINDLFSVNPAIKSSWTGHILFSTEELVGTNIDLYSCPTGYSYNPTYSSDPNGACVKVDWNTPFSPDSVVPSKTVRVDLMFFSGPGENLISSSINYGNGNIDNAPLVQGANYYTYPSPASGSHTITSNIVTNLTTHTKIRTIIIS